MALAPFIAELPEGAALIAEYRFSPAGEGSVHARFRLLIETRTLPLADAHEEALRAREELGVCLRVLSAWYAFAPVQFKPEDRQRWLGSKVRLRAQPRLFTSDSEIGFVQQDRKSRSAQILLPQPASGDVHARQFRDGPRPLLLESARRCCVAATIRAARGLTSPLSVRVGLRRRNLEPKSLELLESIARSGLSASMHGEVPLSNHSIGSGRARDAAQQAIDQLIIQPESVELFVESDGTRAISLALLRILGRELIPDFASEVTESISSAAQRKNGRTTSSPIDLSQLFVPGSVIPPLLPSPPELEALSFPRHFPNPTVMFPVDGLHLGRAQIGGVVVDVRMPQVDRSRHTHLLGATGTGKSTLLYNMAVQDMHAGHGLAVIDPHGDLYEQLLLAVPPERKADLLLIDPEEDRFCPGLNPLDFDGKPDIEGVSRVANDMLDIFEILYDMRQVGGPGFEDYFRNSMLLAAAAPRGGPSASDGLVPSFASIPHVLRDDDWRDYCLSKIDAVYGRDEAEPVHRFFKMAAATTGEQKFANWAPYISSKLTRFVTNATLRKLFCKGRRTLDFRSAMDQRKIVLVNLGKGDLGSSDSRVIGMLLTKYLFHAALSRSDLPRDQRLPFYFYLDEFQNFVATDIPEMLAEARKYGLHMILANQTLGQLMQAGRRETLDAVLGNVATKLFLRVGLQEASAVANGFAPHFDAETLTQLPDRHVLCRLQMKGQPSLPFVFETLAPWPLPPELQSQGAWRGRQKHYRPHPT
ncbi:type IV secretory system conjugative DNA transfer family protein [Paucibacter sp. JuS9]|uniref:type IV secretory system conjugative DNA transfer family protein n=1 Tax=Paucibacter sp. JuS9 TaxID=3228748 RepID=UPI0037571F0E